MISTRIRRGVGSIAAAALVLSGASLALAVPAIAADDVLVHQADIGANESVYKGWHEGYANSTPAHFVGWNGLHLGGTGATPAATYSQIINGLVDSGQPGLPISDTNLSALITGANVGVTAGSVFLQVAVTTNTGWATLRPAAPASTSAAVKTTDLWTSSRTIGTVVKDESVTLGSILSTLGAQGNLRYSAVGILATSPAVVSTIAYSGTTYRFAPASLTAIPVASHTAVTSVRPNEDTYPGWHEGYVNATPAYQLASDGLHLTNSTAGNSQVINGLTTPLATTDIASLITTSSMAVASGTVSFQVPVFFGSPQLFATLRPAVEASTPGTKTFALTDAWVTSKTIPATNTTAAIAKDVATPLGDVVDALNANGSVKVLAFGVLAMKVQNATPAVVSSVAFNGVSYDFAVDLVASTLALTGAPDAALGSDVVVTATVSSAAGTPTGEVEFFTGHSAVTVVPLVNGVATYTVNDVDYGSTLVFATYTGSAIHAGFSAGSEIFVKFPVFESDDAHDIYVESVYEDLLNRPADLGGLDGWSDALDDGAARASVANGITGSDEYRARLITKSYGTYLGRDADAQGLANWITNMGAGLTVEQMEAGFIASDEFVGLADNDPEVWVRALYALVLERGVGQGEVDFWTAHMATDMSRYEVALSFLLSTEHLNAVIGDYYGALLGRGLDATGQATWVTYLQNGGRDEVVIAGIIGSDEYFG